MADEISKGQTTSEAIGQPSNDSSFEGALRRGKMQSKRAQGDGSGERLESQMRNRTPLQENLPSAAPASQEESSVAGEYNKMRNQQRQQQVQQEESESSGSIRNKVLNYSRKKTLSAEEKRTGEKVPKALLDPSVKKKEAAERVSRKILEYAWKNIFTTWGLTTIYIFLHYIMHYWVRSPKFSSFGYAFGKIGHSKGMEYAEKIVMFSIILAIAAVIAILILFISLMAMAKYSIWKTITGLGTVFIDFLLKLIGLK